MGWLVGNAATGNDSGLRNWCVAAAVIPDIDAASFLFGAEAYSRWHHTFGHNVLLGVAISCISYWQQRARGAGRANRTALLVAVCFVSHLLSDAKLSAYSLKIFWPFSHAEYEFTPNLGLASPINTYLVWASFAAVVLVALWRHVTPLNVFTPRLDRILINAASPSRLTCHVCSKPGSQRCDFCKKVMCLGHAAVERGFRLRCVTCGRPAQ